MFLFFDQTNEEQRGKNVHAVSYAGVDSLLCVLLCQCYQLIHNKYTSLMYED